MDVAALILFDAKRQAGQEFPLRPIKTRARPRQGDFGARAHSLPYAACRIVIAQNRHGPSFDIGLDGVDRPAGICAVPDIVPEKHLAIHAGAFGVREAGRKGLAVGVNIAQQRNPHERNLRRRSRAQAPIGREGWVIPW
jgi:hypothetical protein